MADSIKLSVLDLSPVAAARGEARALHETVELARAADRLGYHRFWVAEHHGGGMLASSAPEILIGRIASVTERLRVGSGGMMLPNHAPLRVAEQFKALAALHPGRIDLGIGRAPGTDSMTALAIRRGSARDGEDFPAALAELLCCAGVRQWPAGHPFGQIRAAPFDAPLPPIFLLGSSEHSAALAAAEGFGFAFAAQINPEPAAQVARAYRGAFRPGVEAEPYAIISHNVVVADSDQEAFELAAPARVAYRRMQTGRIGPLPGLREALDEEAALGRAVRESRRVITGSPTRVRQRLDALVKESGVDEVMVMASLDSIEDRVRSLQLLAEAYGIG